MFIPARAKAVNLDNILSGWRGAGLVPSDPQKILDRLPQISTNTTLPPVTPPDEPDLDFSLLKSSPPDGTELRESNILLNSVLAQTPGLISPAKRYVDRVTRMAETQNAELILMRKQLQDQQELLQVRKTHKRGKRVRLEGEFVYSTQKVLDIARDAESARAAKRPRGRPRKRAKVEIEVVEEDEVSENSSTTSEDELA
jgi:hypothetical protein